MNHHSPSSRTGFQLSANMIGTMTSENAHIGGSSLRSRLRMTLPAGRASERAISEPARANITPMDGKRTVSQAQPKRWKTTTRTRATALSRSR